MLEAEIDLPNLLLGCNCYSVIHTRRRSKSHSRIPSPSSISFPSEASAGVNLSLAHNVSVALHAASPPRPGQPAHAMPAWFPRQGSLMPPPHLLTASWASLGHRWGHAPGDPGIHPPTHIASGQAQIHQFTAPSSELRRRPSHKSVSVWVLGGPFCLEPPALGQLGTSRLFHPLAPFILSTVSAI